MFRQLWIVLLPLLVLADFDCLKYAPDEFTTLVECPFACEYTFKKDGSKHSEQRMWGGCGNGKCGCRNQNDVTICTCRGNQCNAKGYDMPSKKDSDEKL